MLTIEHHSSMVRSGRLALPTPDWRTGTLLLRHERGQKTRPMPDSGRRLASIISDWAKRSSDLGITIGASLRKMAAPAGFAPALPGLKFRCPRLLDDEAVWSETSAGGEPWGRGWTLLNTHKNLHPAGVAV